MPTVLDFLSKSNPKITDEWNGKSYSNTGSGTDIYDGVIFDETCNNTIQEWTDFTYEAIYLAYGDILERPLPANFKEPITPTTTPTTIAEEDGIDALGEAWTCNIVRGPIKTAGAILRRRAAVAAAQNTDPFLSSFKIRWKHPRGTSILDPDWAILDRTVDKLYKEELIKKKPSFVPPRRFLAFAVGDSKMWQKWQSYWLQKKLAAGHVDLNPATPKSGKKLQNTHDVTQERLKPLAQLATYCRFAETRYAFILTQKELVAFRVRRIDHNKLASSHNAEKPYAVFEYKAIPWDSVNSGKLTVNLAIWALGCMGMNNQHRDMEAAGNKPLDSMVRLTKWTHDTTKKLYRNVISGREIGEAEWLKLGGKSQFMQLDDAPGGLSSTSSFTVANMAALAN